MKPTVSQLRSWRPSVLQEQGGLLRHRGGQVDDASGEVRAAFTKLAAAWTGAAADSAQTSGAYRTGQLSDLAELMDLAGGVLLRAGDDLSREKDTLTRLLDDAASHGCSVAEDGTVSPPPVPTMPAGLTDDEAHDWTTSTSQQADANADLAASLTRQIQACLTAAGSVDDAAAAALNSANATATPWSPTGGGIDLGTLEDYQPMDGVTAPKTLLADFGLIDTDGDGKIDTDDLKAAAANESLPSDLRDAAQYLLANPTLYARAETMHEDYYGDTDGTLSRDDLTTFVAMQPQLAVIAQNYRLLDTADEGGDPDGFVSEDDLKAAAASTTLPVALRTAAQWFLDHKQQRQLIMQTTETDRFWGEGGGFSYHDVVSSAIDDQVFTDDPAAAAAFVKSLPFPKPGETGLPLGIVSDDGFKSIANAALIDANGDLTETHDVISHLPETHSALRNQLITGSYMQMGQRMDQLLNGPLAGHPDYPGSAGANWMLFAPWASDGVRPVIDGDFRALGIGPMPHMSQAAADGNQWIYGDIGGKYASFLEFYDAHPNPTPDQLAGYFGDPANYGPGDQQIQAGMAAYSELMTTDDPVHRQELAYQGNVLIAVHEQNGAQPWLEDIAKPFPAKLATNFIDLPMGVNDADHPLNVDHDVPDLSGTGQTYNNDLLARPFMSLDPGHATAAQLAPTALGGQSLPTLTGEEVQDKDFPVSLDEMHHDGGWYSAPSMVPNGTPFPSQQLVYADPDTLQASGAQSWTDPGERMYMLAKLFEQEHTSTALVTPEGTVHAAFTDPDGRNNWLDPRTGLR